MSHEMELEDFIVDLKRKVAVVEEQNQALREQNSRLTLALDEALAIASIVRLECECEELRATVALLEAERDLLRVRLTAGARGATLEEVRDSVREKYDPEYEFGGGQDE
jgi:hypothetical protein